MLPQLHDRNTLLAFGNVVTLILIGFLALLPIMYNRWMNSNGNEYDNVDEVVVVTAARLDEDGDEEAGNCTSDP